MTLIDKLILGLLLVIFGLETGIILTQWYYRKHGIQHPKQPHYDAPVNDSYQRKVIKTVALCVLGTFCLGIAINFGYHGQAGLSALFTFAFLSFCEAIYEYTQRAWRKT